MSDRLRPSFIHSRYYTHSCPDCNGTETVDLDAPEGTPNIIEWDHEDDCPRMPPEEE